MITPTTEPTAEPMDFMKRILTRNALKWHCGHDIQCRCGAILDCRRAVEIDAFKNDALLTSKILCAPCWDRIKGEFMAVMTERSPHIRIEINDGRELFGRAKRSKKS